MNKQRNIELITTSINKFYDKKRTLWETMSVLKRLLKLQTALASFKGQTTVNHF